MLLVLSEKRKPAGLSIMGNHDVVFRSDCEITMYDFLCAAYYVLTSSDLVEDDPRLQFVKRVSSMRKVKGYYPGAKRLSAEVPPVKKK